ncbi:hypothetical protein DFH06DRAFT_1480194 [Mycena polygramma]|nr:hypothetical protein DFH06DRAFT_1480194 [Mycena polygramma]
MICSLIYNLHLVNQRLSSLKALSLKALRPKLLYLLCSEYPNLLSTMNKSQFYLSQCVDAASKAGQAFTFWPSNLTLYFSQSTMYYTLGAVIVKGGKVLSSGCNHQRPNYDTPGSGRPVSMHAEMASIFNATRGAAPARKQQAAPKQKQHNNTKKAKRYPEEYRRDLEYRRESGLVPYKGKTKRAFYPSRHYPHHQGQEAAPAYEQGHDPVCAGAWDPVRKQGRSRYSKLNGCDLYVCRVTKNGEFGCSKPCWRCVDWCAWAGIRRIFHWSMVEGRFICLKVGDASKAECYETITDLRYLKARASLS